MDNNYAEQAIRPFTVGRKNFVITESDKGAKASAFIYSLAETAKANNLNTYKYFELLLTEMPKHMDDKNLSFLRRSSSLVRPGAEGMSQSLQKIVKIFQKYKTPTTSWNPAEMQGFSIYGTHV